MQLWEKLNEKTKKALIWALDLIVNVVIIFILVIVIQTWIIAPFDVYGPSMCDTLNFLDDECETAYGEKIILNEALYIMSDPQRGDIVVFKTDKDSDKYFIKRIIGMPGETVEIKRGKVYITGVDGETYELEEEYLNAENRNNTKPFFSDFRVFEVPEGHYFTMGDNRRSSSDSRSCFQSSASSLCTKNPEQAFVSKDNIRGKAWIVWWPISSWRILDHPEYSESLEEK